MKRRLKGRNKKSSKLRKLLRMAPGSSAAARDEPVETTRSFDGGSQPSSAAAADRDHTRFLAELGTGLWRLRRSMVQPGSGDPSEEMRRAYRHFEAVWDVLTQAGVEVQDHTGAPFHPGMSLKVIAFQPAAGIERESVTETIRPSVYYNGASIQMGEVIVGTPETPPGETGNKETRGESVSSEDVGEMVQVIARQRPLSRRN